MAILQDELSELKKKSHIQKQQLEEKCSRLSKLESFLTELQESSQSKEEKLKLLDEENAMLKKQLENSESIEKMFEKGLKSQEELPKQEEELQLQKEEHTGEPLCQYLLPNLYLLQ